MAAAANRWCRVERMSGAEVLVVMGVSGVGKTTVGERLAARLGWTFLDADDLHPPANVAKMRGGHPLNDADRGPWLDAVGRWIDARAAERRPAVVACSALKRAYRDRLRAGRPMVRIVYLEAAQAAIAQRLAGRKGHYWPASLLPSQFADLEPPAAEEDAIVVDADQGLDAVVAEIATKLA
jgi:gluconokinase